MSKLKEELKKRKRNKIPKDEKHISIEDVSNVHDMKVPKTLRHFKDHHRVEVVDPHRSLRRELFSRRMRR